jgi:hypothetical protein
MAKQAKDPASAKPQESEKPSPKEAPTIRITPKLQLSFTGGKSGKKFNLGAGVPVEVDPADIKHLDPADFVLGDAPKAESSKKKIVWQMPVPLNHPDSFE